MQQASDVLRRAFRQRMPTSSVACGHVRRSNGAPIWIKMRTSILLKFLY